MRIGNFNSLTEMAQRSTHNTEYVSHLKTATSQVFDQAMDKLLIDKSATSDQKMAALEDLKDLRQAMLVSIKRPESAREANIKASLDAAPNRSDMAREFTKSFAGSKEGTTVEREFRALYFSGPNNGREIADSGRISYEENFRAENFDQMTGSKNFLKGLSNVIGLASAVAALPPGPMAVTVASMAKEEAFANFDSQSSGSSSSQGGSVVLMGLGGISSESSMSSHQSKASGNSTYNRESTDERLATSIQELDFQMEQAESRPANQSVTRTKFEETIVESQKVPTFFGLGSRTVDKVVSRSISEYEVHARDEFEPDRLWLPETSLSEFS